MPTERMSRFGVFIGVWNTSGEARATDAGPAGVLAATDSYRWLPGRHFIVHDVDARFDGKPARSMEVIGYDETRRHHFACSYDDQGSSESFVVELRGRRWTILGEKVRFSGSFNASKSQLSGLWEMKGREARWQPWIDLTLVRT